MYPITGFYFIKHTIIYSSIVDGTRYASTYNREGLTDEQAKGKFLIDHNHAVEEMIRDKKKNEKLILS